DLDKALDAREAAHELLGVFSPAWVEPLAGALGELGLSSGLAVYGSVAPKAGVDEFSTAGDNTVAGFGSMAEIKGVWSPESLGLSRCAASELKGGTAADNVALMRRLALGDGPAGLIDTVALNAGAAFWIVGKAKSIEEGTAHARGVLTGGATAKWLEKAATVFASVQ
ncbi:MAG TPA: anthranilate phosphoribosyltransferase, partial [Opitutales bacterium]|nr:anthranilate phosphoribosyltransferase [Opitutales bacterium]